MTFAPTFVPSVPPTTSLPTATPSITGAVTIIGTSKVVNESLTSEEIAAILAEVADSFSVNDEDVDVSVVYETTGTINVTFSDDVKVDDLEEVLEEELAELLGLHGSDIDVNVNLENGTITYTIVSDTAEEAIDIAEVLSLANTSDTLADTIETSFPAVEVDSVDVDDVKVDMVITVDTSDASEPLTDAESHVETYLSGEGFTSETERKLFL